MSKNINEKENQNVETEIQEQVSPDTETKQEETEVKKTFIDNAYVRYCNRRNARLEKKRQKEEAKANKPKPTVVETAGKVVGYGALGLTAIGLIVKAAITIASNMSASEEESTSDQIQAQIENTGWIEGEYTDVPSEETQES